MNERNKSKTVRNIILGIVVVFLFAVIILGFFGYRYVTRSVGPLDPDSEEVIEVEIPTGATRRTIGGILEEEDVINSSFIFEYYVRFKGNNDFKAGTYLMSPSMSMEELMTYLNEGGTPIAKLPTGRVTLPEGIHLEDIADRIESQTDFTADDFMSLIQNEAFINEVAELYPDLLTDALAAENTRYTLEGYLFPATYEVYEETTLEALVKQMISRMDQAVKPHYETIAASELNVHETLALASHIEREGVTDEDRALISGVFYNRLAVGMMLQTDPSVSYAHGSHRERTSLADLEIDSPYNTYRVTGVGAGPISSPSESAINASVNPTETEYYYFLADLATGNVYYAEDYDEHLRLKAKYLD